MAYPNAIRHTFIELRSQGISLDRIAKQLGIAKSTAVIWQTDYKTEIDDLKGFRREAIRNRVAIQYQEELQYAMAELKRLRAELNARNLTNVSTPFLHYAEAAAYRRVQNLCALGEVPDFLFGAGAAEPDQNPTISLPTSPGVPPFELPSPPKSPAS
jgi:hypothetical protein